MKIAITTVQIPFVTGGAEYHTRNLQNALRQHGHEVEIVTMPFMDSPLHYIENHIVAARLLDLENSWAGKVDLCIGMKFPAYYIPHPNKVLWVLHQHRTAYELYNTAFSNIKNDPEGNRIRQLVMNADNRYMAEAKRIYANSGNVANRMKRYNGIDSTPLYHPCPDMEKFYCGEYEDYILMPSRINVTKRQLLAIEAMCLSKSDIKLYIVGKADNEGERQRLLAFIEERNLQDRIRYFDYVTQEEKFKLYANARAVLFIPLDEDYGYITLEAMSSSKPVITAKDSGGPLEFVIDGKNGRVVEPTPEEIAHAMDELAGSVAGATEMGRNAKKHLDDMEITWDKVVKELTR